MLLDGGLLRRWTTRRRAYRRAFWSTGRDGEVVLADLARFCHATATTHVPGDPCGTAQLEGRRQVWLRIQEYLRLQDGELEELRRRAAHEEGEG